MESLHMQIRRPSLPSMSSQRFLLSSFKSIPKISHFSSIQIATFYSTLSALTQNTIHNPSIPIKPISASSRSGDRIVLAKTTEVQLKEDWLASLSSPLPHKSEDFGADNGESSNQMDLSSDDWVIGIDPDIHGALSLLKGNGSTISAEVFDSPHLQLLVGGRVRRRLDAKSIVQLLRSFGAPIGTTAYIEQSNPYPQDGKQGWWSGGFGYGLWIGILVALGFSVVPVSSQLWKKKFELSGNGSSKDDSRRVASALFPLLSSQMKRKKDHGRAEALLIAAYGKGLDVDLNSSFN